MSGRAIVQAVFRARLRVVAALWGGTILFIISECMRPPFAHKLTDEFPSWTYGTALQLSFAGVIALQCALISRIIRSSGRKIASSPHPLFFVIAGFGLLFLGADEMLMFHERIGTRLQSVPWIRAAASGGHEDDLLILVYGAAGLIFAFWAFREITRDRQAFRFFMLAGALAALAVLADWQLARYCCLTASALIEETMEMFFAVSLTSAFIYTMSTLIKTVLYDLVMEPAIVSATTCSEPPDA